MRAWERENTMYLPIDFYRATLAMGHLALSLSPPLPRTASHYNATGATSTAKG